MLCLIYLSTLFIWYHVNKFSWLLIGMSTYNLLPSARYSFRRNLVNKRLVESDVQHKCQPLWSLLNYSYHLEVVAEGKRSQQFSIVFQHCFSLFQSLSQCWVKRTQILNLIDVTKKLICLFQASMAWCSTALLSHPFNSSCHMDSSKFIPLKVWDAEQKATFDFIK